MSRRIFQLSYTEQDGFKLQFQPILLPTSWGREVRSHLLAARAEVLAAVRALLDEMESRDRGRAAANERRRIVVEPASESGDTAPRENVAETLEGESEVHQEL
jgi:hypothetical protein